MHGRGVISVEKSKIMDIFAYYFSEYDMRAFETLGFKNRIQGIGKIADVFGMKTNYLKRLRDEYDVVTNSTRNGQKNRPPRKRIEETAEHLSSFSFEEITELVKSLIENQTSGSVVEDFPAKDADEIFEVSESELENVVNAKDPEASIRIKTSEGKIRVYKTSIIKNLKKLYGGCCQRCGKKPLEEFGADICEAHHIEYFSESQNNDSSNLIILCPNHHRLIHKLNPVFDAGKGEFDYGDGKTEKIKLDYHLLK